MNLLKKWWFYVLLLIIIYFILVLLNLLPIYHCISTLTPNNDTLKQCGWYLLNTVG